MQLFNKSYCFLSFLIKLLNKKKNTNKTINYSHIMIIKISKHDIEG